MTEDEGELFHGAPVSDVVSSHGGQAQLGQQLLDEDDKTDGRDEAAQKGLGQHAVEETQAKQAGHEDSGASGAGDDATDAGMHSGIVVGAATPIDATLDNASDEKRARGLGAEDHLGGAAEQGVAERVEDEGVEAVDGGHVGEIVGEGESHGQVHAGDGQGGDEVALEEGELVLAHPDEAGQVVGDVHESTVLDAVPLCELAGPVHGLALHTLGPALPPVGSALGGHKGDDAVYDGQ